MWCFCNRHLTIPMDSGSKIPIPCNNTFPYRKRYWKHVSCKDSILCIAELQLRLGTGGGKLILLSSQATALTLDWLEITISNPKGLIGQTGVGRSVNVAPEQHMIPSQPSEKRSFYWDCGLAPAVWREAILPHSTGDCLLRICHIVKHNFQNFLSNSINWTK